MTEHDILNHAGLLGVNPIVAGGDLVVRRNGRLQRLPLGPDGSTLTVVDGHPTWVPIPLSGDVFTYAIAPRGAWTELQDPKAYHYAGRTYTLSVNGLDGNLYLLIRDHVADVTLDPILVAENASWGGSGPDLHDTGALIVREPDHRLLIAYCGHSKGNLYTRLSTTSLDTDPELADGFAAAVARDGQLGGGRYTYPFLAQLLGVTGDPVVLIYRDIPSVISNTGRIAYSVSTDGGDTFGAQVLLFSAAVNSVPYWRIATDWDTRIDIVTTDIVPDESNGLWHLYIDFTDETYHHTDGTEITGTLPLLPDDLTPVLAYGADGYGTMMCWGISYDVSGNPHALVMQHPLSGATDNAIRRSSWNGSAWATETIVESVGGLLNGNTYATGAAILPNNPDVVYAAKIEAGRSEMFRYIKSAGTWGEEQLTALSDVDHFEPTVVYFGPADLLVAWLTGTYGSDTNFNLGITGSD